MNSRSIIHLCITLFFALGVLWVMGSWEQWAKDGAMMHQFLAILILAIAGGFFVVLVLLPRFGDAVGTAMLSSGELASKDSGRKAAALLAEGDDEGAIAVYEQMLKEKPDDPHPISEMARICADEIKDPVRALHILAQHLEKRDWTPDNAAFLMFRMVDIHLGEQDYDQARDILEQIEGYFPGTRHSANARNKIQEVEQTQYQILQRQSGEGGTTA